MIPLDRALALLLLLPQLVAAPGTVGGAPAAPSPAASPAVSASHGPPRMTPWRAAGTLWEVPPFSFRDGFWINLHHFLYQQALAEKEGKPAGEARVPAELSVEERTAWSAALSFYGASVIGRDLLFDDALNEDADGLAALDDGDAVSGAGLEPELTAALAAAAPVYRAHWWPSHDRANRFWIAMATPLVQQLGARMQEQLAAAYGERWPARRFLVDVAVYASWAGAYTSARSEARPVHTVISSFNPGYQGFAALEMVFHEASHAILNQRTDRVTAAIERECREHGWTPPRNLTHAIIFYTAGEIARRNLARVGVADYVPYAERQGLWTRAWPTYKGPLERFWQPYLDGKTTLDGAIAQIVQVLGSPAAGRPG